MAVIVIACYVFCDFLRPVGSKRAKLERCDFCVTINKRKYNLNIV